MSEATRIASTFSALKSADRMAFMPFIAAGDPDVATTAKILRELASAGADLIEIGFPYSDPIADGPVIQASYTRALSKQVKLKEIFEMLSSVSGEISAPLVGMVSYAIIFRYGTENFVKQARSSGLAGLIVPDLPGDEAATFAAMMANEKLDLIQLIAPTTPPERAVKILQRATGFVYCIAVSGTTGVRKELAPHLADMLKSLRSQTNLPLAVGFGISGPDQIEHLRGKADGVIVGSAIVKLLEPLSVAGTDTTSVIRSVGDFTRSLAKAAHRE
ncbi:tryptophan synthase subunit alpha [Schlesneria paludicola]|uniref:tryptophan synthase subunit alpha n=1 Tax=Schlesneria paludicola TaxID=360056 RepID=UPI00029A0ED6|nr:tryptophan synthase subunit alpha [Schlesneria paludicola]